MTNVSKYGIRRPARAFTLPEVLVASTLSVVVMACVLSAFLFFGRTGLAAGQYQEMEAEVRACLERFSEDVRTATDIRWTSAWNIALSVPGSDGNPRVVSYVYEPASQGASAGNLNRVAEGETPEVLVRDIANDFAFKRFKLEQPGVADNTAGNDLETKQLQLNMRTLRSSHSGPATTQAAVSARYVLRNKRVAR